MTHHITIGIDPGQTGAIAVLRDGEFHLGLLQDMPVSARKMKGQEVNAAELSACLRGYAAMERGAHVFAAVEQVGAMPGQGISSTFKFGEGFGIVKGVLATLGIGYRLVTPVTWKRHHGLLGTEKDAARTLAIQRFPAAAEFLARKKDGGRADALLLAHWAYAQEMHAEKTHD